MQHRHLSSFKPESKIDFHQQVYDRHGVLLRVPDPNWEPIRLWFDAHWSAAFPKDCSGLTYLDVGCCDGLYPLRFAQRGGVAVGLNPSQENLHRGVSEDMTEYSSESEHREYVYLKAMYQEFDFKVLDGGFIGNRIVPAMNKFDYVSCMNVLEYLPDPEAKVAALFELANTQVMITTDVSFDGTKDTPELSPLLRQVGLEEFASWSPWPCKVFTAHCHVNGLDCPQGVLIARKNGCFDEIYEIPVDMNAARAATQIAYEKRL